MTRVVTLCVVPLCALLGCGGSGGGGAVADAGPDLPGAPAECQSADHCITVSDDGAIDEPDLTVASGDSVAFVFANRWQSVVDISRLDSAACDDDGLELPYAPGSGVTGPMPHLAGGIVVRGTPDGSFRFPASVWESDAISGVLLVIPWADVAAARGAYDFTVFTDALQEATKYGKLVSIGIQAGSKCPSWIYDPSAGQVPGNAMVTKATGGDRCFNQVHPSFWDPNYVQLMTELQTSLADTLKAHAGDYRHVDKIKISGVNLMTSETRMPVSRESPCGFDDRTCSNGTRPPELCVGGQCPLGGECGCFTDPDDGIDKCGRATGDLPQQWADAGYRPSKLGEYFRALFDQQHALFPGKDINLMQISRAFPNVDGSGIVRGAADPNHVRALIAQEIQALPESFVVLNAALNASAPPQDICMESYDSGAAQIGLQAVNGLDTWSELEPALQNARDSQTPAGVEAVSFVEIYLSTFLAMEAADQTDSLKVYDETFRVRSQLPTEAGEVHRVEGLAPGTYHYKIAGTYMRGGACHTGTLTVEP